MPRMSRSRALAERASYLCACALAAVLYLFVPYGGYERMMEGKTLCFAALALGYLVALCRLAPPEGPDMTPMRWCAAAYLGCSALSALLSPFGVSALLGGTRREGLATLALYVLLFFCFSRYLSADRRLLYLAAACAALCCLLTLAQLAGRNPLGLYPAGLGYADGDVAYAGFYAGTSGNIDFTAFLLALVSAVMLAALARQRLWLLCAPLALALWTLGRLGVAAAWAGLAFAALWGLALLLPERRGAALSVSALVTLAGLALLRGYDGANRTLWEASRLLRGDVDAAFGSGRLAIWRDCLRLAAERPLFGGGPDTLWLRGVEPFSWYRDGVLTPLDITAAHNEYLNILVNQGALALAAYLALLGCALARCFRCAREPRFALCGMGLLCYAAMAAFSVSTPITAPYVWLLLAIVQKDEISS